MVSHSEHDTHASSRHAPKEPFVMRWLTTLSVVGVDVGVFVGLLCQKLNASKEEIEFIGLPGELFIRAMRCLVVPMVFCSLLTSTASMSSSRGGARIMARWALTYYLVTTFIAATTGVLFFHIFHLGFSALDIQAEAEITMSTSASPVVNISRNGTLILPTFMNFGRKLLPDSLFAALAEANLLGIIMFAMYFGHVLTRIENGRTVIAFFGVCFKATMVMVRGIITFTPIGVGSLVAQSVASMTGFSAMLASLGPLVGVVLFGQFFHVFVTYAVIYAGFTRKNPYMYLFGLPRAWITAFGTSSSAATLSTSSECCESLGVSRAAINFVLPIGVTVNMDGSALERPLVLLFIAYVSGQPLDLGRQVVVVLTSVLLSIAGSPIPSAGLSTIISMIAIVDIERDATVRFLEAFLLAIDWFLDGVRTSVNVTGDSIGVAIIDHRMNMYAKDKEEEGDDIES